MKLLKYALCVICIMTCTYSYSMLIQAARTGDKDTVEFLLKHGADSNEKDSQGNTALHYAAMQGHTNIAKLLLEHGAHPHPENKCGSTPLMWAEFKKHNDIVTLLKTKRKRDKPLSPYKKKKIEDVMEEV